MAELINMALPKPKKGEKVESTCIAHGSGKEPKFPWGLEIRLEDEVIKKLGLKLKDFDTDTMVHIVAKAETTRVSEDDTRDGGKQRSLSFQITDMALTREGQDDFERGWTKAGEGKGKKPEKGK